MSIKNIKDSGILIFIFLVFLFIGPSILFFLRVPILRMNVILYFFGACLFYHFLHTHIRKQTLPLREFFKTIVLSIGVIFFSLLISCF